MTDQKSKLLELLKQSVDAKWHFGNLFEKKMEEKSPLEIVKNLIDKDYDLNDFNAARHAIDDCNDAIKSFIESGGFDDKKRGDSLLNLYGVLSAVYIQQEMVKILSETNPNVEKLKIRNTRNNFAAHPKRTKSKENNFYIIHPNSCVGYRIAYSTRKNSDGGYKCFGFNRGEKNFTGIDLELQLTEHLKFMTSFFLEIQKKL